MKFEEMVDKFSGIISNEIPGDNERFKIQDHYKDGALIARDFAYCLKDANATDQAKALGFDIIPTSRRIAIISNYYTKEDGVTRALLPDEVVMTYNRQEHDLETVLVITWPSNNFTKLAKGVVKFLRDNQVLF